FNIKTLWFPILISWVKEEWRSGEAMYLVMDRSQWRAINLLMVSIVYDQRAIPVYFTLLPKKGNSNLKQQKQVLSPALKLLKDYKITVLGDARILRCGISQMVVIRATGLS
ncbi:MAG: IS4 family transposase, partial [Waterburya sp.]